MPAIQSLISELSNVDIHVSGVCDDTRKAKAGDLFLAVTGEHYTATQMLRDLGGKNVAAVIVDSAESAVRQNLSDTFVAEPIEQPVFAIEKLAEKRGEIASLFFNKPSEAMFIVAITGTNGKTSCSQFIANALGERCGVVGTMGWGLANNLVEPGLTTPDALRLQELLATMLDQGANAMCLEASSHGLDQHRLNGTSIDVAVLTNLTRDHLDYHGSIEAYKKAKKILFQNSALKTAVLNADDPFSQEVESSLDSDVQVIRYSLRSVNSEVYFKKLNFTAAGIQGEVQTPWGEARVDSCLIGDFNASNLLTVVSVLGLRGVDVETIGRKVNQLTNVKGRMDKLTLSNGALVVIDYAHTPDALENALSALRCHTSKNLICVMGCGGDRDTGKRALMGEIATRLADITIVTDDNPRSEPSEEIIQQIVEGVASGSDYRAIPDRGQAIDAALSLAGQDDVVLIAGKGHEDYQEISGVRQPFSDHVRVHQFDRTSSSVESKGLVKTDERNLIIGYGMTGQSIADYYQAHGVGYWVVEDSIDLDTADEFKTTHGALDVCGLSELNVSATDTLMVSPGVPVSHPKIQKALRLGAKVSNDVQLFSELCEKPLALITGSNGKSTVTDFVGQLLDQAKISVGVGGNIGIPALSLLSEDKDVYVLEVSSYQLELAVHARTSVAVLLNLTPDHLDRYDSLDGYYRAKLNIFNQCDVAIVNREITYDLNIASSIRVVTIGFDAPCGDNYGIVEVQGVKFIVCGKERLVCESDLPKAGRHNLMNVMAAIAICKELGADQQVLAAAVPALKGLAHRFETVHVSSQHLVINDSKSTNPASTLAALQSLENDTRPVELILGGLAKGADFSVLDEVIKLRVHRCMVYGADRMAIAAQLSVQVELEETLDECLESIDTKIPCVVLFSPACASQDQFDNFSQRGEYFKQRIVERFL